MHESVCGTSKRDAIRILGKSLVQFTLAEQQIHRTTLHQLALEPRLPAPALLIVGQVARPLPHFEQGEKASPRAASKPHEEVLHLTDTPIRA